MARAPKTAPKTAPAASPAPSATAQAAPAYAPEVDARDPKDKANDPPVHVSPTPAHLIRMTHPDGAQADGFERDESGAVLVPYSQVSALQSHGFLVDHLGVEAETHEDA